MARENAAAEARAAHLVKGHGRVLELGCGPGVGLLEVGPSGVGVDVSQPMVQQAADRAPDAAVVRADADALPFASNTFDAGMAVHALALLSRRALLETRRVLVGGAPFVAIQRLPADGGPDPARLQARLEAAGFSSVGHRVDGAWTLVRARA